MSNTVLFRVPIVNGEHCIIVQKLDVNYIRVKKRLHHTSIFRPIDYMSFHVDIKRVDQTLNIAHRQIGVPVVVHMHSKWPKTFLPCEMENKGAVNATGNADDTIVRLPITIPLYS
jgi:hypothetical protein